MPLRDASAILAPRDQVEAQMYRCYDGSAKSGATIVCRSRSKEEALTRINWRWMSYIARGLALLWAIWWAFFVLFSGVSERASVAGNSLLIAPGLILLFTAAIPWRWEPVGGAILVIEGLIALIGYPLVAHDRFSSSTVIFVVLAMALPPLVAGALFLAFWQKSRTSGNRQDAL